LNAFLNSCGIRPVKELRDKTEKVFIAKVQILFVLEKVLTLQHHKQLTGLPHGIKNCQLLTKNSHYFQKMEIFINWKKNDFFAQISTKN
jgi:hypothetical protein